MPLRFQSVGPANRQQLKGHRDTMMANAFVFFSDSFFPEVLPHLKSSFSSSFFTSRIFRCHLENDYSSFISNSIRLGRRPCFKYKSSIPATHMQLRIRLSSICFKFLTCSPPPQRVLNLNTRTTSIRGSSRRQNSTLRAVIALQPSSQLRKLWKLESGNWIASPLLNRRVSTPSTPQYCGY